jgi:hypothetical protein
VKNVIFKIPQISPDSLQGVCYVCLDSFIHVLLALLMGLLRHTHRDVDKPFLMGIESAAALD